MKTQGSCFPTLPCFYMTFFKSVIYTAGALGKLLTLRKERQTWGLGYSNHEPADKSQHGKERGEERQKQCR